MWQPFFQGMGVGGGLIVAIGAQNAFVLTQGVRRRYSLLIPALCSFFDAVFIFTGVLGVGALLTLRPELSLALRTGGAAFLFWYGWRAFCSALQSSSLSIKENTCVTLRSAVWTTLAVTLLNPHVYLDTMVLMGGISTRFSETGRYLFGAGGATASIAWFFGLSLFGRLLAPLFERPIAWRILDGLVCAVMWGIGISLAQEVMAAVCS
ncbi:MAG: amino acid transporter [Desulfobacterales bacterium]|nr:MAG: amino acid transporter [Desulfobacterales bacterium]